MINRDAAALRLQPYAAGLVELVEAAWQAYLDEGNPRKNRTTRANIVSDYMHDLVATHLPDVEPLRSPRPNKPFYSLGGMALRLKYLRRMRTSNIVTYAQDAIARQQIIAGFSFPAVAQLSFDDMAPAPEVQPPYVSVGYVLDATETFVAGVYAICQEGRAKWAIDLRDLAAAGAALADLFPITPIAPTGPGLPEIVARPAASDADDGEAPATPRVAAEDTRPQTDDTAPGDEGTEAG